MSTRSISRSKAAATRRMLQQVREIAAPPGWALSWTVEMVEAYAEPNELEPSLVCGSSDFDSLDDAVENFYQLRKGRHGVRARIVARLKGPVSGTRHAPTASL